jgi:hypothetical protein
MAVRWLTRLQHRFADVANLLEFSLSPLKQWNTTIQQTVQTKNTAKSLLKLEQWGGSQVGSGGFVWGGARRLAHHFSIHGDGCAAQSNSNTTKKVNTTDACTTTVTTTTTTSDNAILGRLWNTLNVLELGAGTGAVGLVCATLGAKSVTLSDQKSFIYPKGGLQGTEKGETVKKGRSLLDLMSINVASFNDKTKENKNNECLVSVRELLWGGSIVKLPHQMYDVICAADVLLFSSGHEALTKTLRALSGQETVVLIEHTDRLTGNGDDYPSDLIHFFKCVEKDALWTCTIVRDHGRHLTLRMVRTKTGETPFLMSSVAPRLTLQAR